MTMQSGLWADTPKRMLTIIIGAPLILTATYIGFPFFHAGIWIIGLFAAAELQYMINAKMGLPIVPFVIVGSALIAGYISNYWVFVLVTVLCIVAMCFLYIRQSESLHDFFWHYITLALGAVLIGLPLALLMPIRGRPDGLAWIIVLFANNWLTDAMALVGGRLFGKTKLAPKISPGKTVEGALVGLICGTLAGFIAARLAGFPLFPTIILNFTIAIVTILGDLAESRVKRFYKKKDTSNLLPGHGGFIDRLDGLIPSTLLLFLYLYVLQLHPL